MDCYEKSTLHCGLGKMFVYFKCYYTVDVYKHSTAGFHAATSFFYIFLFKLYWRIGRVVIKKEKFLSRTNLEYEFTNLDYP